MSFTIAESDRLNAFFQALHVDPAAFGIEVVKEANEPVQRSAAAANDSVKGTAQPRTPAEIFGTEPTLATAGRSSSVVVAGAIAAGKHLPALAPQAEKVAAAAKFAGYYLEGPGAGQLLTALETRIGGLVAAAWAAKGLVPHSPIQAALETDFSRKAELRMDTAFPGGKLSVVSQLDQELEIIKDQNAQHPDINESHRRYDKLVEIQEELKNDPRVIKLEEIILEKRNSTIDSGQRDRAGGLDPDEIGSETQKINDSMLPDINEVKDIINKKLEEAELPFRIEHARSTYDWMRDGLEPEDFN